jgi:hypothetical protein
MPTPQEGAIGVKIVFRCTDGAAPVNAVNIASATVKRLIFKKPNGSFQTVDAIFETDGSDGLLSYTTLDATFLTPYGTWQVQAYVEKPGYFKTRSAWGLFDAAKNIDSIRLEG